MSEAIASTPRIATARQACTRTAAPPLKPWMLLLVGALAFAVYANSLRNEFTFDDVSIIKNNPHVVDLEWTTIWTDSYWPRTNGIIPDDLYRPLTLWSYLANQAVAPGLTWPFHLVNITLHALVAVLSSVLAWRILGNARIALVAGILFAVHPIHTEVVANTVGRAELLAALWSLLALLVFLPPTPLVDHAVPVRRPWWHGLLVAACFFAAILSKETPVALVLLFPALHLWRWLCLPKNTRPGGWRWMGAQALRYYLPLGLTLGIYLWMRIQACGLMTNSQRIHPVVNMLVAATPLERVVTPFMLLAKYLWLICWPVHLSADYSAPSLVPTSNLISGNAFQPPAVLGLLLCILAIAGAVMRWRKSPQFALLLICFISSYALVANFLRIGTIFGERLFYWPSVFVLILVAWALVAGWEKIQAAAPPKRQRAFLWTALLLLAIPVAAMSRVTWQRNTDWSSNITLAISTARDNPASGKACNWAGSVLAMSDKPDIQEFGKTLIERAIELTPNFAAARWEMAKYYGVHHDLGRSAIYLAQAVQLDPGSHMSCVAVPALLEDMRGEAPEKYMPVIAANLRDHPDDPAAHLAMAYVYHAQKQYDQAAADVRQAIDLAKHVRPDGFDQFHEAGAELAAIWLDQGRIKEAVDKYRVYVTFMRQSFDAHCVFAGMLLKLGAEDHPEALQEAASHLLAAAMLEPTNARVRGLVGQLNALTHQHQRDLATAEPGTSERHVPGVHP